MTLSWALYALLLSLAVGWAAAASERVLRMYDVQARWVWAAAMLVSVIVPVGSFLAPDLSLFGAAPGSAGGTPVWAVPAVPALMGTVQGAAASGPAAVQWAERAFYVGWVAGSAVLFGRLLLAARSVRRRKRDWRPLPAPGGPVYRDEELGPAAVGVLSPDVVLPEWVMDLEDADRRMVLLHEREHARTGDPALVAAGSAIMALTPWNLLLWWQFRRLRQAVELDCDLRVVGRVGDRKSYGRVLLEAARNSDQATVPLVAGGESFVGDRIRNLVDGAPPFRPLRAVSGLTAVVCAAVLAATLPSPRAASAWSRQAVFNELVEGPRRVSQDGVAVANEAEVMRAIRELHPDDLREKGVGGIVNVLVHVRSDGTVGEAVVQRSSGHPDLDRAARQVARRIRFELPEQTSGRSGFWIVQPVSFGTD